MPVVRARPAAGWAGCRRWLLARGETGLRFRGRRRFHLGIRRIEPLHRRFKSRRALWQGLSLHVPSALRDLRLSQVFIRRLELCAQVIDLRLLVERFEHGCRRSHSRQAVHF
jgi:hypothetical protein